jgi:tetratricopeptide (TPR) repeat protein
MSFQGDVRGIGLAELLQGLARGRKEGILTLTSTGGQRSLIGLEEGKAHLLPDPEEDPEKWRGRARDAWADETRVDYLRMSEIARAQRLEDLYCLLDGEDVHFRFEPGLIPRPGPAPGEEAQQATQVFCDGMQVEFLLLEYARVADELEGAPGARDLPDDLVPCVLDPTAAGGTPMSLLEQCDGLSTLQEIADRLGWPVRQAKLTCLPAMENSCLRRAHPSELLQLALKELQRRYVQRAAVRLNAWCSGGMPGPLDTENAEALESEWLGGRLTSALRAMPARARRTLLRRMDHALANPSQTVVHWLEATRLDKTDRVASLKRMAAEFREDADPESPSVRDLLDWAKDQRENGFPRRAAPALVMAAHRQPTNVAMQLELGTGLVAAGRALEGAPWVLAGGRELLEHGNADRAITPLRSLLEKDPRNRECRQLLNRARRQSTQVRKLRKNLLIGLAGVGVLAGVAMVKVRQEATREGAIDKVRQVLGDPQAALLLLDRHFTDDISEEVRDLRDQIEERQRLDEFELRSTWLASYHAAQIESTKGDPLVAFDLIRAVPSPPQLKLVREPWPNSGDLYEALTDHLNQELSALGEPVEGSPQQVAREDLIEDQAERLAVTVLSDEALAKQLAGFAHNLEAVGDEVEARRAIREEKIQARLAIENLDRQDELYRKGEAYARSGDFVRAMSCWEECVTLDDSGKVAEILEPRIAEVREQMAAVERARELALAGEHEQAIALLESSIEDPSDFILPWKVESFPSGVKVAQGADRLRTTPFEIATTLNEHVELTFSHPGFMPRTLQVDRPGDQIVHLERSPNRAWASRGRVDAIPVPVGDDHVLVDRKGWLVRLGTGGVLRWEQHIKTLSGLARAPVFLPHRPGHMLLVTEDGDAWIISAETGHLEGPWQLDSPPVVGPAPNAGHVRLLLGDGRQVLWSEGLKPVLDDPAPFGAAADGAIYRYGAEGGFAVARRRAGHSGSFDCPWNDQSVKVEDDAYVITRADGTQHEYSVLRQGDWEFISWESASARVPNGRLWISDAAGLRAYAPLETWGE